MKPSFFLLLFLASTLYSCLNHPTAGMDKESRNGIYYWKTRFELNHWEQKFLQEQHIERLYLRVFDVDFDEEKNMPVPIATTRFADSIPSQLEIVPVIYLTVASLKDGVICDYDKKIYERIQAMVQKNGLGSIREIQLDCDWTASTETVFFRFCQQICERAHTDGIRISATIRLHQLTKKAPPVDQGVLMLYNTGSLYHPATENSILDVQDVKPYLKRKIRYALPLSHAYPAYGWAILLRNQQFAALLHRTDFSDTSRYTLEKKNLYRVKQAHYLENKLLKTGDLIRLETSRLTAIQEVRKQVEQVLQKPVHTLVYHLDSLNLSAYSPDELNQLYPTR